MPFTAATCPNCGGNLQLEDSSETGFCQYCGSRIVVKDAIQKYKVEISGRVSMSGISSVENDIKRGQQCLAAKDWETALQVFSGAVDKQADSFDAWLGCLSAMTQNFTTVDYTWVKLKGVKGMDSVIRNCIKYATPEQKILVRRNIDETMQSMQGGVDEIRDRNKRNAPISAMCGILGLAILAAGIYLFITSLVFWFLLLNIVSIVLFMCASNLSTSKDDKAKIQTSAEYIQHIRAVNEESLIS